MFKKIIASTVIMAALVAAAVAGFDQYTSKNYTQLMTPRVIASSASAFSNALDGVDISGLVGNGAVVISYCATNLATSVLSVSFSSSATTNGTYTTYTNADGQAAWVYTNAASAAVFKFKPNTVSKYFRTTVTPTAVTNGTISVMLVTE